MENYINEKKGGGIDLKISYLIFEEEGFYVAIVPSLRLSTRSKISEEVLLNDLNVMVEKFLKSHVLRKNLSNELQRLGWEDASTPPYSVSLPTDVLDLHPKFHKLELHLA